MEGGGNSVDARGARLVGKELEQALVELRATKVLAVLKDSELSCLQGEVELRSYKPGAVVVRYGESASSCFIIIKGRLAAKRLDPNGKELTLGILEPGRLCGELALLSRGTRSTDLIAEETCILAEISERGFRLLLAHSPVFSDQILTSIAQMAQTNADRLHDLSFLDLNQRLFNTLVRLATKVELGGRERLLVRELPAHQVLANLPSCTREAVTRALKQLEKGGTILIREHEVEIL